MQKALDKHNGLSSNIDGANVAWERAGIETANNAFACPTARLLLKPKGSTAKRAALALREVGFTVPRASTSITIEPLPVSGAPPEWDLTPGDIETVLSLPEKHLFGGRGAEQSTRSGAVWGLLILLRHGHLRRRDMPAFAAELRHILDHGVFDTAQVRALPCCRMRSDH